MGGLGYLEVLEDGSYKGPIDKFIPDDCKEAVSYTHLVPEMPAWVQAELPGGCG